VTLTERAPRLLDQLRAPRRVLPVTLPMLALVLTNVVVHTGGRHIDLEVYRYGVQAWLAGGDMYGTLPETSDHITLPFIYPPFAAILFSPLAHLSTDLSVLLVAVLSHVAVLVTAYSLARSSSYLAPRSGLVVLATAVLMPVITGAMYIGWKQMLADGASAPRDATIAL
jgi:alpha-1,2-mannosyltransferase